LKDLKAIFLCLFVLYGFQSTIFGQGNHSFFIQNKGQWPKEVEAKLPVVNGGVFITKTELRYALQDAGAIHKAHHSNGTSNPIIDCHNIFIKWMNANPDALSSQTETLENPFFNYYLGRNIKAEGCKAFSKLSIYNIYPTIDLEYLPGDNSFKYNWIINDPSQFKNIELNIQGAEYDINKNGNLIIYSKLGNILEQTPIAWQINEKGNKIDVPIKFKKNKAGNIVFKIKTELNPNYKLIIDPKVIFATFSGSKADNFGFTATYDSVGHGFSGGTVYNVGFPITAGAFQKKYAGGTADNPSIGDIARDIGYLKYSSDGSKLLYSTYVGGKGNEQPHSMVVDNHDNLIIFGTTTSSDFPISKKGYDTTYNDSSDIYLIKFTNDSGKLIASTFIGGTSYDGWNGFIPKGKTRNVSPLSYNYADQYRGEVICDPKGNVYFASSTYSKDFPKTSSSAQSTFGGGRQDALAAKLSTNLDTLFWSSYIGGSNWDVANALEIDRKGNLFVTGGTLSPYFFKDTLSYQKINNGGADAFVCSISNDGKKINDATYIGTTKYDQSFFVQIDSAQNIYLYGQTAGTSTWPIINSKYSTSSSGQFINKFNHGLDTLLISSTFGAGRSEVDISPSAFLVDNCGKIYVSGWGGDVNTPFLGGHGGSTKGLPLSKDAIQTTTDGSDFYIAVFARNMDTLLFGSYFGGTNGSEEHVDGGTSRFDKRSVIYQSVCGGCGGFSDFPTTTNAYSRKNKGVRPDNPLDGGCNNLLFKVDLDIPDIIADFEVPKAGCYPFKIKIKNTSIRAKTFIWDFGDGSAFSSIFEPLHTYPNPGKYTIKLIGRNYYSCSVNDTISKTVTAYAKADARFSYFLDTCSSVTQFDASNSFAETYKWDFGDGSTLFNQQKPLHVFPKSGTYKINLFVDDSTKCTDTFSRTIILTRSNFDFKVDTCTNTIKITSVFSKSKDYIWAFDTDTIYINDTTSYTFNNRGNHTITLIVNKTTGFCDTIIKSINIPPRIKPVIDYSVDSCGRLLIIKSVSPADGSPIWLANGKIYNQANPKIKFDSAGKYIIKYIRNIGSPCQDTTSFNINLKSKIKADFSYTKHPCKPILTIIPKIFGKNNTYLWNFGDSTIDTVQNPKKHIYTKFDAYRIKLTLNKGKVCEDTFSRVVQFDPNPKLEITAQSDSCNTSVIFHKVQGPTTAFRIDYGDGQFGFKTEVTHSYPKRGKYTAIAVSNDGTECADTVKIVVNVGGFSPDSLIIPNIITPNNDGKNDSWRIGGQFAQCTDYEVFIFTRWGQEVYHRTSTTHDWPGTSKAGTPLAEGVYYFIIKGVTLNFIREGTITIQR